MKLNLRLDGVMWTQSTESKWSDEEDDKKEDPEAQKKIQENKSPEKT